MIMKQTKISYWLKGMTLLLAVMGIFFFGALTAYAFQLKAQGNVLWGWVGFSWYIAVLCYLILFEFWRVCTQIGKDNSFSLENAKYFHHMGLYGIGGILGFAARMIWVAAVGKADIYKIVFVIGEILIAAIFTILCECLSRLVQYAYDVKRENELTI